MTTTTIPFAALLPVLTLDEAQAHAAALARHMHIPTHVAWQRGRYRVWDDGDIAAGYADAADIVWSVEPESVYFADEEEIDVSV